MANLLRFDFNDRDGIFEMVENGDWVRATDYDALAAKLAEADERIAWLDCGFEQAMAERDEALNQLDSARYSIEVLEKRVAKLAECEARLEKAVDVAEKSIKWLRVYGAEVHREASIIKELKGQNDDQN